jgi:hypothetical protein
LWTQQVFFALEASPVSDYLHGAADQAVSALADALRRTEGVEHGLGEGIAEVLRRLAEQDLSRAAFRRPEPARIPACRHLPETVGAAIMVDSALAAALAGMEDELHWRHSEAYSDAAMGQVGFMDNYGHAEIIGPHGCLPATTSASASCCWGPACTISTTRTRRRNSTGC